MVGWIERVALKHRQWNSCLFSRLFSSCIFLHPQAPASRTRYLTSLFSVHSLFLTCLFPFLCCGMLSHSIVSSPLPPQRTARLCCPWDSAGKNTGVGYHALLQGILLTQGLKLGLPHCRWTLFTVWATPHFSRTSSKFSSIINLCVLHFCWLCLYSLFIYKFLDGNNVVFRIPVYSNAYAEWVLNKLFFKWIWIFYEDLCIEHSLHKTLKIISFSPLNEILLKIIM